MEIIERRKERQNAGAREVTSGELEQINALAKRALTADEVYAFAVRLCDNEIDRDGERFTRDTLDGLAALFVGKSGIFDHEWSAKGQTARIYRTEVVEEESLTAAGDPYCYVKGYAYMLRSAENAALIAEIEGGIKKEVSVGCSVGKSLCSICGQDIGSCGHERGKTYDGKLCFAELSGAVDAYEWSFVAVPAQPRAGVMKRFGQEEAGSLKALVKRRGSRAQARELDRLERQAELGRKYVQGLRKEVARLMLTAEEALDGAVAEKVATSLDEPELRELEKVYGAKVADKLGLASQLGGVAARASGEDEGGDFRV